MRTQSYSDALRRIWGQISANSANIGDLFERIAESFYTKLIRAGDTVIDGGAHTGRHTIPLARLVGDNGRVLAFEPLPSAAATLERLLAAEGLDRRVRLHPEALAREAGRRSFFVVRNMPEFSGLQSRTYIGFVADETEIQVNVQTLDAVVGSTILPGSLSFVKLDLEGEDFRALQGAEGTLRTYQPSCVFENGLQSSATDYSVDEFFGFFDKLGFDLYDILGCHVDERQWTQRGPWCFVAIPETRSQELLPQLWTSVLEEILSAPWVPGTPSHADQVRVPALRSSDSPVIGYVDRVETCLVFTGWAADPVNGRPALSVVVTEDGVPVATSHPGKARLDVAAATGQIGFAHSGFEVAVRASAAKRVEVHAEGSDGGFVKLEGPASG